MSEDLEVERPERPKRNEVDTVSEPGSEAGPPALGPPGCKRLQQPSED